MKKHDIISVEQDGTSIEFDEVGSGLRAGRVVVGFAESDEPDSEYAAAERALAENILDLPSVDDILGPR